MPLPSTSTERIEVPVPKTARNAKQDQLAIYRVRVHETRIHVIMRGSVSHCPIIPWKLLALSTFLLLIPCSMGPLRK
ncbi:hypothetical protein K440DRAFT_101136 [Wilcoxina mikolae CBS 423.85]|nr:hypothetical protein K440DRAFT_101136 [Wilcoxina mikolae CBS 423.85]